MLEMGIAYLFLFLIFAVMVIGNFVCQIYVANKLYAQHGAFAVVIGVIRANRTFFLGWQSADLLEIRSVMMVWSFFITIIVLEFCGFAALAFSLKK